MGSSCSRAAREEVWVCCHEEAGVRVEDCGRRRRLTFSGQEHLEQCSVTRSRDGTVLRDLPLDSDYSQALCLSIWLLRVGGWREATPLTMAVLGGGCCVWPCAVRDIYGDAITLDVCELSGPVISVAKSHFGLGEDERIKLHHTDGAVFIAAAHPATYNAIIIDCCSHAPAGSASTAEEEAYTLEAPPAAFVNQEWFRSSLYPALVAGGMVVMNVVGCKAALAAVSLLFASVFSSHAVLCTRDDNCVFFGIKGQELPSCAALAEAMAAPDIRGMKLCALSPDVQSLVHRTAELSGAGHLMGWLLAADFDRVLADAQDVYSKELPAPLT